MILDAVIQTLTYNPTPFIWFKEWLGKFLPIWTYLTPMEMEALEHLHLHTDLPLQTNLERNKVKVAFFFFESHPRKPPEGLKHMLKSMGFENPLHKYLNEELTKFAVYALKAKTGKVAHKGSVFRKGNMVASFFFEHRKSTNHCHEDIIFQWWTHFSRYWFLRYYVWKSKTFLLHQCNTECTLGLKEVTSFDES